VKIHDGVLERSGEQGTCGRLRHGRWRTDAIALPHLKPGRKAEVSAPAKIEIE
jgi:hypothetical protein